MRKVIVSSFLIVSIFLSTLLLIFGAVPYVKATPTSTNVVDWWPMWRHDARRSGYSTSTAPNTNHTRWTYSARGWADPIAADGMVFIAFNADNATLALNVATGQLIWRSPTPSAYVGGVAVAYDTVFVQCDAILYALDEYTGAQKWNSTDSHTGCPAVADGMVFINGPQKRICCFNATTGALKWSRPFGYTLYGQPAVADGMVFIDTWSEGKVYALEKFTGAIIWSSISLTPYLEAAPVVVNGKVYMGGGNGVIYVLDEYTGTLVKTYGPVGGYLNQGPVLAYGKLFVGTDDSDRRIYAIDEASGAVVWSYYIGPPGSWGALHEPKVADHKVFVTDMVGTGTLSKVYALNADTGQLIWTFTGAASATGVAIANGMVFVSVGNITYAFGPPPVGGIWVPVDKFGLLAPYIGLTSTIILLTVATVVYIKRVKRRKEKQ